MEDNLDKAAFAAMRRETMDSYKVPNIMDDLEERVNAFNRSDADTKSKELVSDLWLTLKARTQGRGR